MGLLPFRDQEEYDKYFRECEECLACDDVCDECADEETIDPF